jgi:hypothetical protein
MIKLVNKQMETVFTISLTETDLTLLTGALSIAIANTEKRSPEAEKLMEQLLSLK